MPSFGARVKQLREKRGWSQQDLAKFAKIPYMTVWRIERDEHQYTRMDVAVKLARTFGVSLDLLCGLYDEEGIQRSPVAEAMIGV
jgi:transcriptional regulator with XRE-family HTH domain